jgi:eukaryotic-like serine/threonine-protein kinase
LLPGSEVSRRVARFGVFEADLDVRELRRQGRLVSLQEHQFQVLAALLEKPGREVSRWELRRRLWPDTEHLDFETGINTAVGRLRQALGDSADNPRFIVTRRGRGYRFLAPVEWIHRPTDSPDPATATAAPPLDALPPAAPSPTRKGRTRWLAAGLGVVALLAGMLLLESKRRQAAVQPGGIQSQGTPPVPVYAPTGETLTGSFALSPRGTRLALATGGAPPEQGRIWLRSLQGLDARPLPGTEGAAMPFWSPDEQAVGFFAQGKLKTIDLASEKVATVADAVRGRGGSWNKDGVILFAPSLDSPILSVSALGGPANPVTDLADAPSHRFPLFLPDGRHFLYLVLREDRDQSEIRWGQLGGPEGGRLLAAGSNASYMERGYLFFARAGGAALLAQRFDAAQLRLIGLPMVVRENVGVYGEEGPTGLGVFSVSSDALAFAELPRQALRLSWFDRHGRPSGAIGPSGDFRAIDLSPDGNRAAVVRFDPRKRSSDLWTISLDTGVQTQVTDDPWPDSMAIWAPSGDRLAFGSLREGRWRGFVRDPARAAQEQKLPPQCNDVASWFPDGKSLVCLTFGPTVAMWRVSIDSVAAPTLIVDGLGSAQGRVSPDGSWLAYSSDHEGRREVYVRALTASSASPSVALGPGDSPRWRRDGRELFFLKGRTLTSVSIGNGLQAKLEPPHPLFDVPLLPSDSLADFLASFSVSPDGSRFLFAISAQREPRLAINVIPHWSAGPPTQ